MIPSKDEMTKALEERHGKKLQKKFSANITEVTVNTNSNSATLLVHYHRAVRQAYDTALPHRQQTYGRGLHPRHRDGRRRWNGQWNAPQ